MNDARINFDAMDKTLRWYLEVDKTGYGSVEIIDGIEKFKVPNAFYDFCIKYDMQLPDAINTIVADFLVRYSNGNNDYEQGILNRIKNADISDTERKKILKIILERT